MAGTIDSLLAWGKEHPDRVAASRRRSVVRIREEFKSGKRTRATEKRCSLCGIVKSASDFYLSNSNLDGLHGWCKKCSDTRTVENGRKRLGLTAEDYKMLLESQHGRCAICGQVMGSEKKKGPHVDHDHDTGMIRGLLCPLCNILLGAAKDDIAVLRAAITYLESKRRLI